MKTFTFHPIRYKGVAYTVQLDGRTIGRVKLDRATFDGWIAYRSGADKALLSEDGYAAEFTTREDAAEALAR